MKSVGEVMAIGRTFQESFQKALRGLETGIDGLIASAAPTARRSSQEIGEAGPERILFVADAFRIGMSLDEIFEETAIDPWFLAQIEQIVATEKRAGRPRARALSAAEMRFLKQQGLFRHGAWPSCSARNQHDVRRRRHALGVRPVYKRVDTCAAEFATPHGLHVLDLRRGVRGRADRRARRSWCWAAGPNRIGQGIEFDYCCVHAALAMREDGYETIMVNCNPETVSTDYDTSDRLYFEPVTLEDVLEIVDKEKPLGVIVQYGGQTPLKLALELEAQRRADHRHQPRQHRHRRGPRALPEAAAPARPEAAAEPHRAHRRGRAGTGRSEIGYPLVVRPSYVLGGRAMEIVHGDKDLRALHARGRAACRDKSPVLLDRFLDDAIEVDVDCISDGQNVMIGGIMEHIEQAGVHSGDSACSLPPYSLSRGAAGRTAPPDRR